MNTFTHGSNMAAQRSLLRALGWTNSEMQKPIVGIICAQSEIIPGHMHLDSIARAVAEGVIAAGGKPVIVPSIGVCDGIAMGHKGMKYSLPSREIIADSAEILITAHAFDACVFVGNCDKIIPGMLMGAVRANVPAARPSAQPSHTSGATTPRGSGGREEPGVRNAKGAGDCSPAPDGVDASGATRRRCSG